MTRREQQQAFISARQILRDVKREHMDTSDLDKSLSAAILSIEVAWALFDKAADSGV